MQDDGRGEAAKPKGERWGLQRHPVRPRLRALQDVANDADCLLRGLDAALMRHEGGTPTDERQAALLALTACMVFIASAAQRTSGTKALRIMAAYGLVSSLGGAVIELDAGIVASVLKPGPKSNRTRVPLNLRLGRAAAAVAVHSLILGGFSIKMAAKFVAKEIAGKPELDGIKRDPWKAIVRWRQDMMAAKDRVPLDSLKDILHSRADVALFDANVGNIQERIDAGTWGRQAGVHFAQLILEMYLHTVPKNPL